MLVEEGADINKTNPRGQNALFYAAKAGNGEVVEYLLSKDIHYTAADPVGNNARIIAYQSGHSDIVDILDNFVRKRNDKISQQSKEVSKEIADRHKAYNEAVELENQKAAISESDRAQSAIRELSFASCAASYWEFCSSVKQPTELNAQDILNNISTLNSRVIEFSTRLSLEHNIGGDVSQNVKIVSGDKIRSQLSAFASNEARRDDGVGTIDDMTKRCRSIADTWNAKVKSPDPKVPVPSPAMDPLKQKNPTFLPSFLR